MWCCHWLILLNKHQYWACKNLDFWVVGWFDRRKMVKSTACDWGRYGLSLSFSFISSVTLRKFPYIFKPQFSYLQNGSNKTPTMTCCCKDWMVSGYKKSSINNCSMIFNRHPPEIQFWIFFYFLWSLLMSTYHLNETLIQIHIFHSSYFHYTCFMLSLFNYCFLTVE